MNNSGQVETVVTAGVNVSEALQALQQMVSAAGEVASGFTLATAALNAFVQAGLGISSITAQVQALSSALQTLQSAGIGSGANLLGSNVSISSMTPLGASPLLLAPPSSYIPPIASMGAGLLGAPGSSSMMGLAPGAAYTPPGSGIYMASAGVYGPGGALGGATIFGPGAFGPGAGGTGGGFGAPPGGAIPPAGAGGYGGGNYFSNMGLGSGSIPNAPYTASQMGSGDSGGGFSMPYIPWYVRYMMYRAGMDLGTAAFKNTSETQTQEAELAFIQNRGINDPQIQQQMSLASNIGASLGTSTPQSFATYVDAYRLTGSVSSSAAMTKAADQLGIITHTDPATTQSDLTSIYNSFGGGKAGTQAISSMPNIIAAASRVVDMPSAELEQAVARGFPVASQVGIITPGKAPSEQDLAAYTALVGELSQSSDQSSASVQGTLRMFAGAIAAQSKQHSVLKKTGIDIAGKSMTEVMSDIYAVDQGEMSIKGGITGGQGARDLVTAIAGGRSGFNVNDLLESADALAKVFKEIASNATANGGAASSYISLQLDQTLGGQWKTLQAQLSALLSDPNNPFTGLAGGLLGGLTGGLKTIKGAGDIGDIYSALNNNPLLKGANKNSVLDAVLGEASPTYVGDLTAMEGRMTQMLQDPNTTYAQAQQLVATYNKIAADTGRQSLQVNAQTPGVKSLHGAVRTSATTLQDFEHGSLMQGFQPGKGAFEPNHPGIDVQLAAGSNVRLPQGGKYLADYSSPYRSEFELANGNFEVLLHLQNAKKYANNQYVAGNTVIGQVAAGSASGLYVNEYGGAVGGPYTSTGPHVHIAEYMSSAAQQAQFDQNQGAINPTALLTSPALYGPPIPSNAQFNAAHLAQIIGKSAGNLPGQISGEASKSSTSDLALLAFLRTQAQLVGQTVAHDALDPKGFDSTLSLWGKSAGGQSGFTRDSAKALLTSEFSASQNGASAKEIGEEVSKSLAAMTSWGAFQGNGGQSASQTTAFTISPQGSVTKTDAANDPGSVQNVLLKNLVDGQSAALGYLDTMANFSVPSSEAGHLPFYEGWSALSGLNGNKTPASSHVSRAGSAKPTNAHTAIP